MGKNQAHKAAQRAKGGGGGGGEEEGGFNDGMTDATFHSPEWHAARLAQLTDSTRMTWEEFKQKQKEDARKQAEAENDEERKMREYRAELDAERAAKLARGTNHAPEEDKMNTSGKKRTKTKDKDQEKDRKHKRRESDKKKRKHNSPSTSETESTDSDHRSERKRRKKEKRRAKSSSSKQGKSSEGPVRLSEFLRGEDSDSDR